MKTRQGFVSNSSSSSFICCLSGHMESGMDLSKSEAGMVECENGHTFLEKYQISRKEMTVTEWREWYTAWCKKYEWRECYLTDLEKTDKEFMDFIEDEMKYEFEEDGIDPTQCPVCTFTDLPYEDVAKFFLAQLGITRKEFALTMKEQFGDYTAFYTYIKDKIK
jgi:hypothetical protein